LRDEAAHRPAHHAHLLDAQDLDYLRGIIGEPFDVERLSIVC
jgi:hypothetical protein